MAQHTIKVEEIDRVYSLSGPQLKKTLAGIGMTQSELARRCGYASAARVCHLVKKRRTRIGAKPLGKILRVLQSGGANVEGFKGGQ